MEDLHRAGGLTTILRRIEDLMKGDCLTVAGQTLAENIAGAAPDWEQQVVRGRDKPLAAADGLIVLRGNIAPQGAVMKAAAASEKYLKHTGRAVVFDGLADMAARLDDPDLDVTEDDVLVLKNAGPIGGPGMPEAGYIPIPRKLAQQGVRDMVRISDARMSGTAFGSIVLHITPEAAVGGPLAAVESGDTITLDAAARRIDVDLDQAEIDRRLGGERPAPGEGMRGYARLYNQTVLQADAGCDFDFARPPMRERL
jgi:dihydroxy-acid dehydratase